VANCKVSKLKQRYAGLLERAYNTFFLLSNTLQSKVSLNSIDTGKYELTLLFGYKVRIFYHYFCFQFFK